MTATSKAWLAEPMPRDVAEAIARLCEAPDVQHVAVMPDVHLASEVCIGVAMATSRLIYPQAVGGDIGCGMFAVAFDVKADILRDDARFAGRVLADFGRAVPSRRRNRRSVIEQSDDEPLSDPRLEAVRKTEGVLAFATLGSGNHFIELQSDVEDDRLWLMVHSGSRAVGPAIRDHHLALASGTRLRSLDASSEEGAAYLHDAAWARRYAAASRRAMAEQVESVMAGARICWETALATDHNHVSRQGELWVHRKGAMPAGLGEAGVLPGSMGTLSFHVEGRGVAESLCSSAHGAGRALSRTEARTQGHRSESRKGDEGSLVGLPHLGQIA